jgi:hypothetical protein
MLDGSTLVDELVTGGGLRRDRPIYVYREFPLTPGPRALSVRFELADEPAEIGETAATRARFDALPRALTLDTTLALNPRAVALVTYDADRRALVIRSR